MYDIAFISYNEVEAELVWAVQMARRQGMATAREIRPDDGSEACDGN